MYSDNDQPGYRTTDETQQTSQHQHSFSGFNFGFGPQKGKRLTRNPIGKMLGGVCTGLADYLGIDVTIVRLGFVGLTLLSGVGIPAYVACWIVIPQE